MRTVRHRIPRPATAAPPAAAVRAHAHRNALLSWPYLLTASALGLPGLAVRWHLARAAAGRLARREIDLAQAYPLLFDAFDTVRHFEFATCWEWLHRMRGVAALDLSSPRMLPLLLAARGIARRVVMLNPDQKDLDVSRELAAVMGVTDRVEFRNDAAASLQGSPDLFPVVTSISVLEHIPSGADREAFATLWEHVAPGGTLVVTVPCARSGFEEYIDFNEYELLQKDDEGFVFGQRFYDAEALAMLHAAAGAPREVRVFGERTEGAFFADRAAKCSRWLTPSWREPTFTAKNFGRFRRIEDLPGVGVVALRFEKRA